MRASRHILYWCCVFWAWRWFTIITVLSIGFIVWLGLIQPQLDCKWGYDLAGVQQVQYCTAKKQ